MVVTTITMLTSMMVVCAVRLDGDDPDVCTRRVPQVPAIQEHHVCRVRHRLLLHGPALRLSRKSVHHVSHPLPCLPPLTSPTPYHVSHPLPCLPPLTMSLTSYHVSYFLPCLLLLTMTHIPYHVSHPLPCLPPLTSPTPYHVSHPLHLPPLTMSPSPYHVSYFLPCLLLLTMTHIPYHVSHPLPCLPPLTMSPIPYHVSHPLPCLSPLTMSLTSYHDSHTLPCLPSLTMSLIPYISHTLPCLPSLTSPTPYKSIMCVGFGIACYFMALPCVCPVSQCTMSPSPYHVSHPLHLPPLTMSPTPYHVSHPLPCPPPLTTSPTPYKSIMCVGFGIACYFMALPCVCPVSQCTMSPTPYHVSHPLQEHHVCCVRHRLLLHGPALRLSGKSVHHVSHPLPCLPPLTRASCVLGSASPATSWPCPVSVR